jgi:hypothetical protein
MEKRLVLYFFGEVLGYQLFYHKNTPNKALKNGQKQLVFVHSVDYSSQQFIAA